MGDVILCEQGPENGSPEVACQGNKGGVITTGGGFSNIYAQPAWQKDVIDGYFRNFSGTSKQPYTGYTAGGRGYPDVSLISVKYLVMMNGNLGSLYGTSATSPVFSGMVALVNAKRLAAGKSTLGWINPSLYALYKSFVNDITMGENNCVAQGSVCCIHGFYCAAGWDPVTGLGSVNYGKFEKAFMALGNSPNNPTPSPSAAPGDSTGNPALAPTRTPSAAPTATPSFASGWFYQSTYKGVNCTNQLLQVEGLATGQCFTLYGANGAFTGWSKIICMGGTLVTLLQSHFD